MEKAGKLWPQKHHTVIYWKWGELEAVRGNYPAAMKWHRKAAQQSPDDATAGIFCGHIAFRQGKISLWEKYERRALECSEGALDEAWLNLGSALHTQGRLEEARDCYLKAIAIDPKYAIAKKRLKDVEQAIQLRQKARSGNEGKSRRSSVAAKK